MIIGKAGNKITLITINGYPAVPNSYLTKKNKSAEGQYLHRMVVYSFGDCNGKKMKEYPSFVIDHKDMDHFNNEISNLQLVSPGINLFRAYYKARTEDCKNRFFDYYNSLDDFDRKILDTEIELDLKGELK